MTSTNKQDMRESVMNTLIQMRDSGMNISVVVADSTSTSKISSFERKHPDAVINVGIAEQNMVGIAAGLSLSGQIVFTANAAPFLLARAHEQVKNDICYSASNVKMLGLNAGFAYGALGATHHCVNDITTLRTFGNVAIYAPVDGIEAAAIVRHTLNINEPAYIRMDSDLLPDIHCLDYQFCAGEPVLIHKEIQADTCLITLGSIAHEALKAVKDLKAAASIINISSIHDLNLDKLAYLIADYDNLITIEEHSLCGGLADLIGSFLHQYRLPQRLKSLGVPANAFTFSGSRGALRHEYRIDAQGIFKEVQAFI